MSLQEPYLPQKVDDVTLAFPANVIDLMPDYEEIPDEFKRNFDSSQNKWIEFQKRWFFNGLKDPKLYAKDGIDPEVAFRHLAAIQGSYQPKHQHKEAAVAYLASLWFDDWKES